MRVSTDSWGDDSMSEATRTRGRVRAEARGFRWRELDSMAQASLVDAAELLAALVPTVDAGRPDGPDPDRHHMNLVISGERGTGKTSLMLTLWRALRTKDEPDPNDFWTLVRADDQDEKARHDRAKAAVAAAADAVEWLPTLDLEPLPNRTNLFVALLTRVLTLLERSCPVEDGPRARLADAPSAVLKFRDFVRDVAATWEGESTDRAARVDVRTFGEESLQREKARGRIEGFRSLLAEALAEIRPSRAGRPRPSLLVLPIDDADLSPDRFAELLRLLRTLYSPQLAFIVLVGDEDHRRVAEAAYTGRVRRLAEGAVTPLDKEEDERARLWGRELAAGALRKLLAPGQYVRLRRLDAREVWRFRPPGSTEKTIGEMLGPLPLSQRGDEPFVTMKDVFWWNDEPSISGAMTLTATVREAHDFWHALRSLGDASLAGSDEHRESVGQLVIVQYEHALRTAGLSSAGYEAARRAFAPEVLRLGEDPIHLQHIYIAAGQRLGSQWRARVSRGYRAAVRIAELDRPEPLSAQAAGWYFAGLRWAMRGRLQDRDATGDLWFAPVALVDEGKDLMRWPVPRWRTDAEFERFMTMWGDLLRLGERPADDLMHAYIGGTTELVATVLGMSGTKDGVATVATGPKDPETTATTVATAPAATPATGATNPAATETPEVTDPWPIVERLFGLLDKTPEDTAARELALDWCVKVGVILAPEYLGPRDLAERYYDHIEHYRDDGKAILERIAAERQQRFQRAFDQLAQGKSSAQHVHRRLYALGLTVIFQPDAPANRSFMPSFGGQWSGQLMDWLALTAAVTQPRFANEGVYASLVESRKLSIPALSQANPNELAEATGIPYGLVLEIIAAARQTLEDRRMLEAIVRAAEAVPGATKVRPSEALRRLRASNIRSRAQLVGLGRTIGPQVFDCTVGAWNALRQSISQTFNRQDLEAALARTDLPPHVMESLEAAGLTDINRLRSLSVDRIARATTIPKWGAERLKEALVHLRAPWIADPDPSAPTPEK